MTDYGSLPKSLAIRLSVNSAEAKAQLEQLAQGGGQSLDLLAEKLRGLGRASAEGGNAIGNAANQNARGFAAIGEAADRMEGRVKGVNRSLNDVRGALELMGGQAGVAAEGMGVLTATIGNVSDAFGVLSAAFLKNPVGLVAAGVAAAAGAYLLFRDRTTDAAKAQEELAKALEKSNELLETQTERAARLQRQQVEAARASLTAGIKSAEDALPGAEADQRRVEQAIAAARARFEQFTRNRPNAASFEDQIDPSVVEALEKARAKAAELRDQIERGKAALSSIDDPANLGANRDAAAQAAKSESQAYEQLANSLDGVRAAKAKYAADLALVEARYKAGAIAAGEFEERLDQLNRRRDEEIAKADGTAAALKAENDARAKEAQELSRLNEATLRDVAAFVAQTEKREAALARFIDKAEEEARLAGETNAVREEGRAILEAQAKLYDEQGRKVRDLTGAEKERLANAVRTKNEIEEQRKAAEKFAADVERATDRTLDNIAKAGGDILFDYLEGKAGNFWDTFARLGKRAFAQLVAESVTQSLFRPVVSSAVSSLPGLFGVKLPGGAAGVSSGVSSGGGGFSATSLIPNPLSFGSSSFNPLNWTLGSNPLASAGSTIAGWTGLGAIAPGAAVAEGAGLAAAATAVGEGALIGGTATGVGAAGATGLSGLGLTALGAGALGVGALAALAFGGDLFGGSDTPIVHADQSSRDFRFGAGGGTSDLGGYSGYYGAAPSRFDWLAKSGQAIRSTIANLGGTAPGFRLFGQYDSIAFPNDRLTSSIDGQADYAQEGDREGFVARTLREAIKFATGMDEIYKRVAEASQATSLQDLASDLDFAKNLKDSIASLGDFSNSVEGVADKAASAARKLVAGFDDTYARAAGIGIGADASGGIARQIRAAIGAAGPQEPLSAARQALANIQGTFAGLGDVSRYGVSASELAAANENAVLRLRDQFGEQIQAILDPAGKALRDFDKSARQMREDAAALGYDLVATEQAIAKQRTAILDSQNAEAKRAAEQAAAQAQAQAQALSQSLLSFLDGQPLSATSSLSPGARFAEAQRQFEATLGGARNGDASAASNLTGAAQALLEQGRGFYGSTSDYAALESFTRSSLVQVGQQLGLPGFDRAVANQTAALVQAFTAGQRNVADEVTKLRDEVARLSNEVTRKHLNGFAA